MLAASKGHVQAIQRLLDNKADIHARDKDGQTALMFAALLDVYVQAIQVLLDNRADIHARDKDGWTALMFAAFNGNNSAIELLLNNRADIHARDDGGVTSLMLAAASGHIQAMQVLLDNRADSDARIERRKSPLWGFRFLQNYAQVVQFLLDNRTDIHAKTEGGVTALMFAAASGSTIPLQVLLDNGADIHARDKDGWTALMWAVRGGHTETIQVLLNNTDVTATSTNGAIPLLIAAATQPKEIVELLLKYGANPNYRHSDGYTALSLAYENPHQGVVALLKQYGAK